jgi:glycosyltransferase involved in cell wall biosynthesis
MNPPLHRLLLLNTDLLRGGTPTVVRELAIRLRRVGVDVEVACLSTWGPVADELREAGVTVTPLDASPRDVTVIPRLVRLVRDRRYTTVLSFLMHANAAAAVASLRIGRDVRWVQSIQTTQPDPWWHWPMQRLAATCADAVVVPSPSAARVATDWAGVPADRVVVIPNAVDLADWPTTTGADPNHVVFLGRLDPIKDVPTLVAAVARLPDVQLHIYGDGADRSRIERAVVDHGIANRVTLHGAVATPQQALANAGMLVLPSLAEGFGLVLIEAMAAGVPVVATDVPGVRDVVRDGVTGLLVPAGQSDAMAGAIRRLAADQLLRKRLTTAAAADVRERFSWDSALPCYRQLLHV